MDNGQKTSALFRRLDRANSELLASYEKLEDFIKVRIEGDAKQKILDWLEAEKGFHFDIEVESYFDEDYRARIVELFEDVSHYFQLDPELNSKVGYHLSVVKYYNDIIELVSGELSSNELEL
jgi:hypothetical protein